MTISNRCILRFEFTKKSGLYSMITPLNCRSEAARVTALAKLHADVLLRDEYIALATQWLAVARLADYQDRISAMDENII